MIKLPRVEWGRGRGGGRPDRDVTFGFHIGVEKRFKIQPKIPLKLVKTIFECCLVRAILLRQEFKKIKGSMCVNPLY